jgi:hypothetical protein
MGQFRAGSEGDTLIPLRSNCDLSIAFVEVCRRLKSGEIFTFDDVRDIVPTTSSLATMRRNGWINRVRGMSGRKTRYQMRLSPYLRAQELADDPKYAFLKDR